METLLEMSLRMAPLRTMVYWESMGLPGDTNLGGAERGFPSTHWSIIRATKDPASPDYRQALEQLCRRYWKPVYAYLRIARNLSNDAAKDATQDFFVEILEGPLLQRFDENQGSFRSYLRGALRYFLLNAGDMETAQKRGGGRVFFSIEGQEGIADLTAAGDNPEASFDRQWARSVIEHALARLHEDLVQAGHEIQYRVFVRHDLPSPTADPATYADVAQEFGIHESDVTNYLHRCRHRFKLLVEEQIRDYVDDPKDIPAELAQILALLTPA